MPVSDIEISRLRPDTVVADYEAALANGARFGAKQALIAGNDPDDARLTANFEAFCALAQQFGIGANLCKGACDSPSRWATHYAVVSRDITKR
jgi:hypothetical protein